MQHKKIFLLFLALIALFLTACSQESPSQGKPIVKVNDYVLGENEFRKRIAITAKMYGNEGALTLDDKHRFLEQEIEKELLIQEAIKLGLEKEPAFRDSIEKFWEQTLITALFKRKARKLNEQSIITMEEVQESYKEYCAKNTDCLPLDKVRDKLEQEIREVKKQKALDTWLAEIRKNADVKIYEDNLRDLR